MAKTIPCAGDYQRPASFSRRRFLSALTIGSSGLLLAACGGSATPAPAKPATAPPAYRGGEHDCAQHNSQRLEHTCGQQRSGNAGRGNTSHTGRDSDQRHFPCGPRDARRGLDNAQPDCWQRCRK